MTSQNFTSWQIKWMRQALNLAKLAAEQQEVPIGACLVVEDEWLWSAHNRSIIDCDPTAHAEMLCLRKAAEKKGNHRLNQATLFVTLEPCMMCLGALIQARVQQVIYAAPDRRVGALSRKQWHHDPDINHRIVVQQGPFSTEATDLLKSFFASRR